MWPKLIDMNQDECKKALRSLELETYSNAVSVLRAQGALGPEKRKLLQELASALNIPIERHKAEVRKAVNDEKLNTIAEVLFGPHTETEWAIEGRRLVPLLPREPPKTVYSIIADQAATLIASENSRLGDPSETANKASDIPLLPEPSSPEPAKTQVRSASPSGVLVLPSGTAIQMKREAEEEGNMIKKRQKSISQETPVLLQQQQQPQHIQLPQQQPQQQQVISPASPPSSKVIIVSSSSSPGTSSILQKTLSVPIKTVPSNSKPTVMYAQSLPQSTATTATTVTTDPSKIRSKPVAAASIPKPRPSAIVVSSQGNSISPQTIQLKSAKPNTPGAVAHLKTALQTTKHTVPIQTIAGMQVKGQSPQTKILVQQKTISRTLPKSVQQKSISTPQQKTTVTPGKGGQVGVVVQPKQGKGVVTNVQVKTPQGFANVPIHLRAAAKGQGLQIKHDSSGNMKMLSISGGTKILPKPSQPVYMVATSTSALSMVTRTIPASSSPRVMAVSSSGTPVKASQSGMISTSKPVQTVHLMTQAQTPRRHQNVVLFSKGSGTKNIPITPTGKEIVGKVVMPKTPQSGITTLGKPVTTLSSTALAQSLQNLPVAQTQSGSVILLDLSNQESMSKNAAIAELLQASGLLGDTAPVTEKTKRISTSNETVEIVSASEPQIVEVEEKELKSEEETTAKDESSGNPAAPTLSIEEAVEMLNRSDTPETRAILSQAGIQISDEIGDSEEDDVIEVEKPEDKESVEQVVTAKKEEVVDLAGQLDPSTGVYSQNTSSETIALTNVSNTVTTTPTLVTPRTRTMDIFSTAIASANINLDNFMEEEDDSDQVVLEQSSKGEGGNTALQSETTDQSSDLGGITSETEPSAEDPIELQLAQLTADSEN